MVTYNYHFLLKLQLWNKKSSGIRIKLVIYILQKNCLGLRRKFLLIKRIKFYLCISSLSHFLLLLILSLKILSLSLPSGVKCSLLEIILEAAQKYLKFNNLTPPLPFFWSFYFDYIKKKKKKKKKKRRNKHKTLRLTLAPFHLFTPSIFVFSG